MTISNDSTQAREAARHSDGTFGIQHLPEPDGLTSHTSHVAPFPGRVRAADDTSSPYRLGEFVEVGGVRAAFTFDGEGLNGAYDPSDPDDRPLLRASIFVDDRVWPSGRLAYVDPSGVTWRQPPSSSVCTLVDASAVDAEQARMALVSLARAASEHAGRGTQPGVAVVGISALRADDLEMLDPARSLWFECKQCGAVKPTEAELDNHSCR